MLPLPDKASRPVSDFLFQKLSLYRMLRLSRRLASHAEDVLVTGQAIRLHDWRMLAAVRQRPGITATEAQPMVLLNKMQASRSVAHLVELGLLKAGSSSVDGRAAPLRLSAKGANACDVASKRMAAIEMWALDTLSAQELGLLDTLLQKIEQRVLQEPGPDGEGLEQVYTASSAKRRVDYLFTRRGEAKDASNP